MYLPHHEDRLAPAGDCCPALAGAPAGVLRWTVATDELPAVTAASSPVVG
ncbi:RNA polymerase sigma-54 factor [Bacillus cereus Rock3-28]|nr:RNA polymerase sigma-54 factor [Bacillus cereus Rock3-28]